MQASVMLLPYSRSFLLESHLKEGNQKLSNRKDLEYGRSITDACINIDTTKNLLQILYDSIL